MRKIHSKKDEAKKNRRNQIILAVIIVFILLGSTFGAVINSFGNSSDSDNNIVKYGDDEFTYQNGFWVLEKFDGTFMFLNNPYETRNISESVSISKTVQDYSDSVVYIYSEDSDSEVEIYRNLYSIAERIQNACPEGLKCDDENSPVKGCDENLIIVQESETNEIAQDKNCIYIKGSKENLIKLSDEFMFKILGVKNG